MSPLFNVRNFGSHHFLIIHGKLKFKTDFIIHTRVHYIGRPLTVKDGREKQTLDTK